MFERIFFAPDDGSSMTGGDTGPAVSEGSPDTAAASAAPEGAAPAQTAPSTPPPPQQQGPDWNSLGVPFDQAQQRLKYFDELNQRYSSDPAWAQKYDQLYGQQAGQQQQQHPYDWMNYDDQRVAKMREYGQQWAQAQEQNPAAQPHPEFAKHNAEINNFMYNPLGQLGQFVTHPKVMGPLYEAMQPQVQDMVQRMLQQQMQPMQQYMHKQAETQFRQQYEKPFLALPDHIKQAHQKGFFGQGNQGIINAIEFAKLSPQQQAEAGVGGATAQPKQTNENKNTAKTPEPKKTESRSKDKEDDEKFDRELHAAMRGKKP